MTLLGAYGTPLVDTPLGMALYRVTDAITVYSTNPDVPASLVTDELATAALRLTEIVLDTLIELGVTETE